MLVILCDNFIADLKSSFVLTSLTPPLKGALSTGGLDSSFNLIGVSQTFASNRVMIFVRSSGVLIRTASFPSSIRAKRICCSSVVDSGDLANSGRLVVLGDSIDPDLVSESLDFFFKLRFLLQKTVVIVRNEKRMSSPLTSTSRVLRVGRFLYIN